MLLCASSAVGSRWLLRWLVYGRVSALNFAKRALRDLIIMNIHNAVEHKHKLDVIGQDLLINLRVSLFLFVRITDCIISKAERYYSRVYMCGNSQISVGLSAVCSKLLSTYGAQTMGANDQ